MKKLTYALFFAIIFSYTHVAAQSAFSFIVVSDTHLGRDGSEDKNRTTLRYLLNQPNNPEAIFVVGDLTDNGYQKEYDLFKRVFTEELPDNFAKYYCLGNHDRYNDKGDKNTRFEKTLGQDLNQYVEINNYPFILISMENSSYDKCYTAPSRKFLSEKLQYASQKYPDKPIFVFFHMPVTNTVYGSYEIGGKDSWGTDGLKDICEQYPQIIAFSGHSHYPIGDERSIHQDKFTSINDGSIAYSEIETGKSEGIHPESFNDVTEGVIVSIDNNIVNIQRHNTAQGTEIKKQWEIKPPHDGSAFIYKDRKDNKAPEFANGIEPSFDNITKNGCKLIWKQATDNDIVHHYKIIISKKGEESLSPVTETVFSGFFLNAEMPQSKSWNIKGLDNKSTYDVSIFAIDSFGNESRPIKGSFTTL